MLTVLVKTAMLLAAALSAARNASSSSSSSSSDTEDADAAVEAFQVREILTAFFYIFLKLNSFPFSGMSRGQ